MTDPSPIHRLFGMLWVDFFRGTAFEVETEIDLSLKQQFLDLVIIRKGVEPLPRPLPDGFEELVGHNLVTFKSFHEPLDVWALFELIGHYVNYRKQYSPSMRDLLPESDFKMFAMCARFPSGLDSKVGLKNLQPGVYEVEVMARPIRIIVASQLPEEEQNARLHVFTDRDELLRYGKAHYRPQSAESSSFLYRLFKVYSEVSDMPDKFTEFAREAMNEMLASMTLEQRLKGVPPKERLKGLSPEEEIQGLSAEAWAAIAQKLRNEDQPKK